MVTFIRDNREKKPLPLSEVTDQPVEEGHLDHGDYTIKGWEDTFALERKGLNDLASCCGSDRERFEKQVKTATNDLDYYGILVDSDREDLYDYQGQSNCPNYYSKIHPNSVIGTIETWSDVYSFPPVRFSGNQRLAAQETIHALKHWEVKAILD